MKSGNYWLVHISIIQAFEDQDIQSIMLNYWYKMKNLHLKKVWTILANLLDENFSGSPEGNIQKSMR